MAGIISYGAYVPIYCLSRDLIAQAWGSASLGGVKAVAIYEIYKQLQAKCGNRQVKNANVGLAQTVGGVSHCRVSGCSQQPLN